MGRGHQREFRSSCTYHSSRGTSWSNCCTPKQVPLDLHERGGLGPWRVPFDVQVQERGKKKKNARKFANACRCWLITWSLWGERLVLITGYKIWSGIRRSTGPWHPRISYIKSKLEKNFTLNIPFLFNLSILQWSIRSSLCRIWRNYGM